MGTDEIRAAAQDFLSEESRAKISAELSRILNGEPNDALTIAFCGTFSSGKSSLINELLRQKFKLPIGANPVTKFVTRLKYAKNFSASYVWHGREYPLSLTDLEEVITGKLSLPDESLEVIIRLPAKILRGGVELLDTPGYLDDQELTDITRAAVATSDIAFFCCNATVAGRRFEVDYFGELEETIGNFAVIINHIDRLNSAEDLENVKRFMTGNIAGRGRAVLHFLGMEKFFCTVAGGSRVDIDEFKKFFSILCFKLSRKFRRRIQRYAYQKRTIHGLEVLRTEVQVQIHSGEYFYASADAEADSEHQKTRRIFLAECRKISEQVEKISSAAEKLSDAVIADIAQEFDSLEAQGSVTSFRDKATNYLRAKLHTVPNDMYLLLKENFPAQTFDKGKFLADYISNVNSYSVPEPVARLVEKKGIGNFLSNIFDRITGSSNSGNCEMIYENYSVVAKTHLHEHLRDKLLAALEKYLHELTRTLKPPAPTKDDMFLEEIDTAKRAWQKINDEIEKYLNFCREKFMWELSSDGRFFPCFS